MKIHRFTEIDSTNIEAFRQAEKGAPTGSIFVAEYQTEGRGKWGRKWMSPKGKDLLFSLLLIRPETKAIKAPLVTQIACRSVAKVLKEKAGLLPEFKRPNDLLIKGRKICGVLVEAKGKSDGTLESLVIGIGINVNSKREELLPEATSILEETGKKYPRQGLFKELLAQLKRDLKEW
jgi:BirA family biotin operon repressor/biotin-[acetyl-CoA-carboxylase] ligase